MTVDAETSISSRAFTIATLHPEVKHEFTSKATGSGYLTFENIEYNPTNMILILYDVFLWHKLTVQKFIKELKTLMTNYRISNQLVTKVPNMLREPNIELIDMQMKRHI